MTNVRATILAGCSAFALIIGGVGISHAADKTGTEQAEEGGKLFGKYCAKCHGKAGEGTKKAPPVVGKDALPLDPPAGAKVRKTQFHTAQDVAAFVAEKMPANKPGSLKIDQ